ncbi:hypothetical protein XarbCFBP8130_09035 [Xanthomonas arboricola]|nr:hypothetical protein XarbCFBP8130_09035 [Xanthomonas arboricola]
MQAPAHAIDGVTRGLPERGFTARSAALVIVPPLSARRPALAARALQGTRASGAQAVPCRPDGRGALARHMGCR